MQTELMQLARDRGFGVTYHELPSLEYKGCGVDRDTYTLITPEGKLARCMECFAADDIVGDLHNGITDVIKNESWKELADYSKCIECELYPKCVKMKRCSTKDRCYHQNRKQYYVETMREAFTKSQRR